MALNFEKNKLIKELKRLKPKKVLVQLPEGVKQNVAEISEEMEKLGIEVVISGETCWGGCSIAVQEAKDLKVDLIVHFGHAKFIDVNFPVLYIEIRDELNLEPILKKSLKKLEGFKNIGFSYSIQHKHDIGKIKKFYESHKKKILLSEKLGHSAYMGHIVGCEYAGLKSIEKKVDCFIILGNRFHAMGAVLAVEKPVILLDVYNDEIKEMSEIKNKILKQRAISIEKLKEAKNVGVIIELKPGQKFGSQKYLVNKLKEAGKKPFLITMNEITPDKIMNFYNIDCFIELGCPRIAIDDFAKYPKPILTFQEALVALNIKTWSDLLKGGVV